MKKIAVLILALAAGASAFAQLSGSYTFSGSTTVAPIAFAAIEQFQKANPGVKISYEAVGSGAGLKALAAGTASLAGSSAELSKEQLDSGLKPVTIALDGLSVVVNKNIKLSNITTDNLAKIYHGDIVNWKDVGGPDLPIVVVNRDESSGTYVAFWEIVCQKPFGKAIAYTKNAIVAKENGEVAAKVASTPGSIGYVGMAFVEEVTKAGGRNLMVNGVADTIANVVAKKYPISRQLYLVTKGEAAAGSVEKAFIDYVLSPKGQAIVKSVDFIPVPKS
ncbi:MAG TPA: phosphate ABC transporter substrate-binding protein [Spirochaetia bacterium]|nr:phosphate ABC transporter substrate-binding protein [Spirochaetia bacterium]